MRVNAACVRGRVECIHRGGQRSAPDGILSELLQQLTRASEMRNNYRIRRSRIEAMMMFLEEIGRAVS
jgi:hypothetical protein